MGAPGFVKLCEEGHAFAWTMHHEGASENYSFMLCCPCGAETWGTLTHSYDTLGGYSLRGGLVDAKLIGMDVLEWSFWYLDGFEFEQEGPEDQPRALPSYGAVNRKVLTPKYDLGGLRKPEHDSLQEWRISV